jgi:NADPH-dependent glutamate synthase beta subunit-like oxidoreductase
MITTTHPHNTHLNAKNGVFSHVWCFMHKSIVEIIKLLERKWRVLASVYERHNENSLIPPLKNRFCFLKQMNRRCSNAFNAISIRLSTQGVSECLRAKY